MFVYEGGALGAPLLVLIYYNQNIEIDDMIIVEKSPPEIVAVRNPIAWKLGLNTNNLLYTTIQYEEPYDSGTYIDITLSPEYPDLDGNIVLDLSQYIRGLVSADPGDVSLRGSMKIMKNMRRKFRVVFEEKNENGVIQDTYTTGYKYALRAGHNASLGQYVDTWVNEGRFLTHAPLTKWVTPNQPDFLYFFLIPDYARITLQADYYWADGRITIGTNLIFFNPKAYEVIRAPSGPSNTYISLVRPQVKYYDLYFTGRIGLFSEDEIISEKRRFYIDNTWNPLRRYYYFENSLGGFDTVSTCGVAKQRSQVSGKTYHKRTDPFDVGQHEFIDDYVVHQDSFEQTVGFSTKEEHLWLRDLLRSKHAYRFGGFTPSPREVPTELIPINIDRENHKLFEDHSFLHEPKFKYTESQIHHGL